MSNSDDCDDFDTSISPVVTELCDGTDNNCNEVIDDDAVDQSTFYADEDEDGFGNVLLSTIACVKPDGYVIDSSDCDDTQSWVKPLQWLKPVMGKTTIGNEVIDDDAVDRVTYYG